MDSTSDPFTRRMLQRAASVRSNKGGSLRCSSEDSNRRMSILRAILTDEPVKIENVEDCRNDDSRRPTSSGVSMSAEHEQPTSNQRRRSFATDSTSFLPRQSTNRHSLYSKRKSDFSHFTGQSKPRVDNCKNSQNFNKSSNEHADYGINSDTRERVNKKEQRSQRSYSQKLKFGISESEISPKNHVMDAVKAFKNRDSPSGTSNLNSSSKFEKSGNCVDYDSYDEGKNSLDLTRTFNSTSLNMTKDSLSSSSYMKGFELGNVVWRGPLSEAYAKSKKKKDQQVVHEERLLNLEKPELVKAVHTEILTPQKMRAEMKTIRNFDSPRFAVEKVEERPVNKRPDLKLPVGIKANEVTPKFTTVSGDLESTPDTPLGIEIKKLDEDIKRLSLHASFYTPENVTDLSPPDRIHPNLSKIKFTPTGYSPKKLYESPCSPEEQDELAFKKPVAITKEKISTVSNQQFETNPENESQGFLVKNPSKVVTNDKFRPNMESTLKSSLTDLSKATDSPGLRESTVSSVTIPPNTPESYETPGSSSSPNNENVTLDSTMPYNIENFLVDALGDDLYNTTMTFPHSEAPDKSISQFNASELISEERTPLQTKNKRFSKKNLSTTSFNRTASIYRSITRELKKKLTPALKSVPKEIINDSSNVQNLKHEDKKIQALWQEVNIQQTLMYQANKALMVCNSMKEFASSTEQVESERSLLIAGLRKNAALEEIKKLDQKLNNNDEDQFCERGEVVIKDFSIPLKEDVLKDESQAGDFAQWFVIAVTHGTSVWATRAVSCPVKSPRIIFNGGFSVPNLSPNFKITVNIFSLKMRRTIFNHDDKYHLNQAEKMSTCPSPKKLILRKTERTLSPKQTQHIVGVSSIKNTSFVLSGTVELYLHDLSLSAPWPLTSLVQGSVLRGTIDLTLSCKLHLSVSHAGFLNHGNEADDHYVVWNRRWCVLQGQTLMFWNYPCDQEDKEPLAIIDLTKCVSEKITVVDRTLCAKPRTLSIETIDRSRRDLLCCDSARDFSQWKMKLNQAISALRDWNVINRFSAATATLQTELQVSDL